MTNKAFDTKDTTLTPETEPAPTAATGHTARMAAAGDVGSLEAEAEMQRQGINDTLGAIQTKISHDIGAQALDLAKSSIDAAGGVIRRNPVPAALIGLGVGLLIANKVRRDHPEVEAKARMKYYQAKASTGARLSEAKETVGGAVSSLSEKVGDKASGAKHAVGRQTSKAGTATQSALSKTGGAIREGASSVGDAATTAASATADGMVEVGRTLRDNPALLGLIGLAAGAAIGAALPSTRFENRTMGAKRDELKDEAIAKGKAEAEKAMRTVRGKIEETAGKVDEKTPDTGAGAAARGTTEKGTPPPVYPPKTASMS